MRVLVTGKHGQVARALADHKSDHPEIDVLFAARGETPFLIDLEKPETIYDAIEETKPDAIVSAAAYTAVDLAEDEEETAFRINAEGPRHIGKAANTANVPVIHLSTDYVFDGTLDRPYVEEDDVAPLGVYGRSKLAGEQALSSETPNHLIFRTAWVYSPYGRNFYKTMLRLAESRDELSVVDDQIGNPTSAHLISKGLFTILERWRRGSAIGIGDVFHFAGPDEMTWCGFARRIFAESAASGGPTARVNPITTADFPTKAARPRNSRLNCTKFHQTFDFDPA
ncbi:MAG: dTDP-4-dehydrorhamnose reductase [Pseudomonadota bacterium]